jgi:hypothetical protein
MHSEACYGVQPSPLAVGVAPSHLAIGRWKPEWPDHEVEEVKFGQGARASGDVADGLEHEAAPVHSPIPVEHGGEVSGQDQSLLHSGRQQCLGSAIRSPPRGRVDEGPGDSGSRRLQGRVDVGIGLPGDHICF